MVAEDAMSEQIEVRTAAHACLVDITGQVERFVSRSGIKEGICCIFVPHTTAGVTINENADPTVRSDILKELDKFVPWHDDYDHSEGNAAAHIKSSLVGSSQLVFISGGSLKLGTWQGIFLAEFDGPRTRKVWLKVIAG
jgi:secondary thiamine-phosphate synthase enzyme